MEIAIRCETAVVPLKCGTVMSVSYSRKSMFRYSSILMLRCKRAGKRTRSVKLPRMAHCMCQNVLFHVSIRHHNAPGGNSRCAFRKDNEHK